MFNLADIFKSEALKRQNSPLELYDIYLGAQDECDVNTKYFCSCQRKINFFNLDGDPAVYLSIRGKRASIPYSSQLEIEVFEAEFDNVDGAWNNWLLTYDIVGKRVIIRKVFRNLLSDPTHAKIMFDGVVNGINEITEKSIKLEFKSKLRSLDFQTGRMQQLYCSYIFGDEDCTKNPGLITDQAIEAGSSASYIIDSNRTEADDYWKDGLIIFLDGDNAGQERIVTSFVSAEHKMILDFALPYTPTSGDKYSLERGCDKSLTVCTNRHSNQANFGGFPHIPMLINPIAKEE
jgi:hypothetical protein